MVAQHATATPAGTGHSLTVRRTFAAPPARVFAAWTTAEAMRQWAAPAPAEVAELELDFRVGGRYRITMRGPDGTRYVVGGVYREIVPDRKVVYTWRWESWRESHEDSIVTVEFNATGGGTELVLTHTNLPDEDAVAKHGYGWEGCLARFEGVVGAAS